MHAVQAAYTGAYQFVYITPEYAAINLDGVAELHKACNFGYVAVDEAHCVADWGRTYRSGFRSVHRLRSDGGPLAALPMIAVTATATAAVQVRMFF